MQEAQISELRLGYNKQQLFIARTNKMFIFMMWVCKTVSLHWNAYNWCGR